MSAKPGPTTSARHNFLLQQITSEPYSLLHLDSQPTVQLTTMFNIMKGENEMAHSSRCAAQAICNDLQLSATGHTSQGPSRNKQAGTSDGTIVIRVQVVQNGAQERLVLHMKQTTTVEKLKMMLHRLAGQGPPHNQRLLYAGKELENGCTLKDHNIRGGIIYMIHLGNDSTILVLISM